LSFPKTQVVGAAWSQAGGENHAYVYIPGSGMLDLNSVTTNLVTPVSNTQGFTDLRGATAINNLGQIVGFGTFSDG
jgi:probable HAF family extracellular repeat protein